jgi:hypothetical protein
MSFIKNLFPKLFCTHDWEAVEAVKYRGFVANYIIHLYVCKKCGKFKKIKI